MSPNFESHPCIIALFVYNNPLEDRSNLDEWHGFHPENLKTIIMIKISASLQGTSISHLGKRNIIFKHTLAGDMC